MVWFWLGGGGYWFFQFVFKRWWRKTRPLRGRKNKKKQPYQHGTVGHCNIFLCCFLQQQTPKVRLRNVFSFSSPTLAPFWPFLRAHLLAEVKLLHPRLAYPVPSAGAERWHGVLNNYKMLCVPRCHWQAWPGLTCRCFIFLLKSIIRVARRLLCLLRDPQPRQPQALNITRRAQ